ncbi:zinc ribbon domain-containing protein [Paenibacillus vini]|uniref:Zinc-ribbon domain-containing protein n=1 Tax=Paenibacillus vini TaxID=1476024 RepID=A0ABQ4M9S1_9BACL|nr:zinc ribbon domain-containing protein [Paenibacillus vini]GIP52743.1 hypothetical protein J42TS3_17780 [Paenibacillus vini]
MFCSNCGTKLLEDDKFCVSCGSPVNPREETAPADNPYYAPQSSGSVGYAAGAGNRGRDTEPTEEDFALFVGKKADEYLSIWNQDRRWNWPAFLFGGYWMLYRGMYLYLLLYLIVMSFMVNIVRAIMFPVYYFSGGVVVVVLIANIVLQAIFALFANKIYLHHARRKIRAINARLANFPDLREERIATAGETSLYIPIALAVLPVLILIVTTLFYSVQVYKEINEEIRYRQPQNSSMVQPYFYSRAT